MARSSTQRSPTTRACTERCTASWASARTTISGPMPAGSPIVTATTEEGMDSILHGWGRPRSHSIRRRARYRNATLSNGYGAGAVPRSVESSRDRSTDGGRRAWRWLNAAAWPSATSPGLLHLAKLEGDAVFCYNREDEAAGPMLLTMTESCYSPRPTTMSERSPGTCGTTNHCVHGEYAGTIGCIDARACGPPSGSSRIVARVRRPPSMGVSSDVNVESSGD